MRVYTEVSDQMIADVLCSGMEGGIGYWSEIQNDRYVKPKTLKFRLMKGETFPHIDYAMNPGGAVIIKDIEREGGKEYKLTLGKLRKGVQLMAQKYPDHFQNMVTENSDAITGDVLVQLSIFGELIYG
jgi:hypothetical protein